MKRGRRGRDKSVQEAGNPKGSGASLNLPNKLTLVRIFLVPFIIVFLIAGEKVPNYTAAAIFFAAVLTDWLDGKIARRTRQGTTPGKLLGPLPPKPLIHLRHRLLPEVLESHRSQPMRLVPPRAQWT